MSHIHARRCTNGNGEQPLADCASVGWVDVIARYSGISPLTLTFGPVHISATQSQSPYSQWSAPDVHPNNIGSLSISALARYSFQCQRVVCLAVSGADGRAGLVERAAVLVVLHLPLVPLEHSLPALHTAVQVRPNTSHREDVSSFLPHTRPPLTQHEPCHCSPRWSR